MPTDRMIFSGISLAAAVLLFTTSVGPALATEKGWYVGFSAGQSDLVDRDAFDDFCNQLFVVCGDKDSDTAFKGIVGYQINNYFGIEGAYFDLGSPSVSTEAPIVATATASMNGGSFSILPQIPILGIGAIFGKIGVAAGDITVKTEAPIFDRRESDSVTGGTLLIGAGGSINLGRNATIRVEWERYAFDETLKLAQADLETPDVDVFSATLIFRFPKN
jgi:opacity protein-like surface antigen